MSAPRILRLALCASLLLFVPPLAAGCADQGTDTETLTSALTAKKKLRLCDGKKGDTCPKGFYCKHRDDQCEDVDAVGWCEKQPDMCPLYYMPVCGCDGKTYGNECELAAAGMSLHHEGACGEEPGCLANSDCKSWEYCQFPDMSCGEGDDGACELKPHVCPEIYLPVCGCDGETYSNECYASHAGVSVQSEGECETTIDCLDDSQCPAGMICEIESWCPDCVNYDPPCLAPCYAKGTCVPGCAEITCMEGLVATDADGDGCNDSCEPECYTDLDCKPGQMCEQTAICPPCVDADPACDAPCLLGGICVDTCPQIKCEAGYIAVDADYDGCYESCLKSCEDGADCKPGQTCEPYYDCPCTSPFCLVACFPIGVCMDGGCDFEILCVEGTEAVDTDGDGCNDTCKAPCEDACDCYNSGLEFDSACLMLCPTCDNYWSCSDAGYCDQECGPVPWDTALCKESECQSDDECKPYQMCEVTTVCPCNGTDPACLAPCWLIGECVDYAGGCCDVDSDCGDGMACVANVCKEKPPMGECWSDADCFGDAFCSGSSVCPCGAACFAPDQTGTCTSPWSPCDPDGTCKDGYSCECLSDPSCPVCDVCWFGCVPDDDPEPVGCYGDNDCPAGTKCNAGDICLPPPGCDEPGAICPAVCYGYCVQ